MRTFSVFTTFCLVGFPILDANAADSVEWHDVRGLTVEGQAWSDPEAPFARLPAKAKSLVRPAVWNLSRHSAGLCVRFKSNATALHARWTLTSDRLAMMHMPATGVSGLDFYVKTERGWRWLANARPEKKSTTARVVASLPEGEREYLVYLPLYNGVTSVEVGIPAGASMTKASPRPEAKRKPIVFYGTSITQGGCASRPGMVHTAILGRWLDRPVINLGFSGNGRLELELAKLMGEIDAALFIVDCLPNVTANAVRERTEPLVAALREARPTTPILLVEDRNYTDAFLVPSKRVRNETSQAALREVFDRLSAAGVPGLYYLAGADLLGADGEGTVDSSHPTDLGFYRQAIEFRKVMEPILTGPSSGSRP